MIFRLLFSFYDFFSNFLIFSWDFYLKLHACGLLCNVSLISFPVPFCCFLITLKWELYSFFKVLIRAFCNTHWRGKSSFKCVYIQIIYFSPTLNNIIKDRGDLIEEHTLSSVFLLSVLSTLLYSFFRKVNLIFYDASFHSNFIFLGACNILF